MLVALYAYTLYQPNVIEASRGDYVTLGPVEYAVTFEGTHNGNSGFVPENTFVGIHIDIKNVHTDLVTVTGGQFYLVDPDGKRHWPIYGNGTMGPNDLYIERLEPEQSVSRTTQFDVVFDQSATYNILVRPAKEHNTIDLALICITNC